VIAFYCVIFFYCILFFSSYVAITELINKINIKQVRRWSSYASVDQTTIESTVSLCIDRLLDRVERYHGRVFVSHALGYLTASKDGLGDVEMEDILSLDDVVLNDVFQHWVPPVRRIPPLLLPRLQVTVETSRCLTAGSTVAACSIF